MLAMNKKKSINLLTLSLVKLNIYLSKYVSIQIDPNEVF